MFMVRRIKLTADKGGNRTYEEIVQNDILSPMGLNHTVFNVPRDLKEHVVVSDPLPQVADLDIGIMNP